MIIENKGKAFKIEYDSKSYEIPMGEMEIANDEFGNFIMKKSREWEIEVIKIKASNKALVKPIEAIKAVAKEEVKEEVKGEVKKEVKTKK